MEEWDTGVNFDRKESVGGRDIAALTDTVEFAEKGDLLLVSAHVFDDGIGAGDIKRVIGKRKPGPVARDSRHFGIASFEFGEVRLDADGGDVFWIGVVTFEVVIRFRILGRVYADIDESVFWSRSHEDEKLSPFLGTASTGDTASDAIDHSGHT